MGESNLFGVETVLEIESPQSTTECRRSRDSLQSESLSLHQNAFSLNQRTSNTANKDERGGRQASYDINFILERRRREALISVRRVTNHLMDSVNGGTAQVFDNQKKLEAESRQLSHQIQVFTKQTNQWLNLLENFNTALKELGDVEHWSKIIEADMIAVSQTLQNVQKSRDET